MAPTRRVAAIGVLLQALRSYREWYSPHLTMSGIFYPKRNGDYVYDVSVTKDETVMLMLPRYETQIRQV